MAGNASILIQEQNSGKRTNFLVFELDGCIAIKAIYPYSNE